MADVQAADRHAAREEALGYFVRPPLETHRLTVSFRNLERSVEVNDFLGEGRHASDSFGRQWSRYRDVQIDRLNGTRASHKHLLAFVQQDLSICNGAVCLEVGSGAGRFTDYLVDLCETVITVDSSAAIFSNVALGAANLVECRGDLFDLPIDRTRVDVVFCRGVVQHTAAPRRAIGKLFEYVRPGGTVLFDVYPIKWYTPFITKYWLRPITRRVAPEVLAAWAERWVPPVLRFKSAVVNRLLPNNAFGINLANQLVPVADFTRSPDLRSWDAQVRWSILDTVDMYTPRYDRPMTFDSVMRTLTRLGARAVQADRRSFCFKAIAP